MPATAQEILARLNAAASQRGLAGPALTAYRRIWRDAIIRAASASLDPAALPQARAEEFYAELTRGREPPATFRSRPPSRFSTGGDHRIGFPQAF